MTDTNPDTPTEDNSRLSNLVDEIKQAVTEIKAEVGPKLAELADDARQRVQTIQDKIDQKLDELGNALLDR